MVINDSQPGAQLTTRRLDATSKTELNQERLVRALTQLYQLLEEYAPSWYTREAHDIATAALKAVNKH